jgi:serine protease AprX
LVYSDRQGKFIQNNLTLQVQIGETIKRGDEGQSNEFENNVEQVIREDLPAGEKVKITVEAERITRLNEKQGFAVVWRVA